MWIPVTTKSHAPGLCTGPEEDPVSNKGTYVS